MLIARRCGVSKSLGPHSASMFELSCGTTLVAFTPKSAEAKSRLEDHVYEPRSEKPRTKRRSSRSWSASYLERPIEVAAMTGPNAGLGNGGPPAGP